MTAHASKDVEQRECSSIAGGSSNVYNHFGNHFFGVLRKLGYQDPAIELLGIYPKGVPPSHKDTPFIQRMNKENVVQLHNEVLVSH